jgi:hypothetical protein
MNMLKYHFAAFLLLTLTHLIVSSHIHVDLEQYRNLSNFHSGLTECIGSGHGGWLYEPNATEAYILSATLYSASFIDSRWFWGRCDFEKAKWRQFYSHSEVRSALKYRWIPACMGPIPDYKALVRGFCAQFNGKSILFVGDSLTGQLFTSFISIFGVQWAKVNDAKANKCYVGYSATEFWKEIEVNPHEIDAEADICESLGYGQHIVARFMRNDWLAAHNLHEVNGVSCDWFSVADRYDMFVLNRGVHFVANDVFERQLNDTLHRLARMLENENRHGCFGMHSKRRCILYRGSHHAIPGCETFTDPQPEPLPAPNDSVSKRYNWHLTEEQNQIAKSIVETTGGVFMDTYFATSFRPGGRNLPDCLHWCLPSPMDELIKVMIYFWISYKNGDYMDTEKL